MCSATCPSMLTAPTYNITLLCKQTHFLIFPFFCFFSRECQMFGGRKVSGGFCGICERICKVLCPRLVTWSAGSYSKLKHISIKLFLKLCRLLGATIAGLCNKLTQLTRHITRTLHTHTGAYSGGGAYSRGGRVIVYFYKRT